MAWRDTSLARRRVRRSSVVMLVGAAFTLLLLSGLALAEASPSQGLSKTERTRLAAGALVTRPTREQRGDLRLLGGSAYQVINRPLSQVWRAVLDTKHYAKMIPTVSAAHEVVRLSDRRVVRFEHRAGPIGVRYVLDLHVDAASHDLTFSLDPGSRQGPRAAWGFISLRSYGDGRTLLSYGVMADPGDGIVTSLLRGTMHGWMLRVPEQMKRFIESHTAQALYAAAR